ncbi:hypothetical protein YSY22_45420 [Brevibacillus formosus]
MNPPPKKPKPSRLQPMIFSPPLIEIRWKHRSAGKDQYCIQLMTVASPLYGCLSILAIKKKKNGCLPLGIYTKPKN